MDNCFFGVMRMSHGLLPKMPTQGSTENVNWSKFWKGLLSNLNNTKKSK